MAWKRAIAVLLIFVCTAALVANETSDAARPSKDEEAPKQVDKATELYNQGLEHVEAGDFEAALEHFERANRERKNDPEIVNMMAFTQRKLGRLDEAFELYDKALKLRPEFPQAREYLGEAHLQAALEQVRILRGYGPSGEQELQQLMAAFEAAAFRLGLGKEPRSGAAARRW